jgi:hypothetical protein
MALHVMKRKTFVRPSSMSRNKSQKAMYGTDNHTVNAPAYCHCPPLSALHPALSGDRHTPSTNHAEIVPAAPELNNILRSRLQTLFLHTRPLSIILLHVTQIEHPTPLSHTRSRQQRDLHHGPPCFIDQILVNLRRVIRSSDQILLHEGTGFALLLPEVDQQGAHLILDRIYHSINLLQAKTVTPPLTRETTVLLGCGSYPEEGSSIEELLYASGRLARSLTLRPALLTDNRPLPVEAAMQQLDNVSPPPGSRVVPFMKLPHELPAHLKRLLPATLAQETRSVPVGRDHQRLTVAMADPTNNENIHRLQMFTAMTIFPVSCHEDELELLLDKLR